MEQNNIYQLVFKVTHAGGSGSCLPESRNLFVTNYHVNEGFHHVAAQQRSHALPENVLVNPALPCWPSTGFLGAAGTSPAENESPRHRTQGLCCRLSHGMPFRQTEGSVSSPKKF